MGTLTTWADVDAALAEWRDMLSVIDENLEELNDLQPMQKIEGTAFVSKVALKGTTEQRVRPVLDALTEVWAHRARLGEIVDQCTKSRSGGWIFDEAARIAEIDRLLNGESIVLPGTRVPLALRSLVSRGQQQNRLSPHDLLDGMQKAFEEARDVVLAVDDAWTNLLPEITGKVRELESLRAEAHKIDPSLEHDCADLLVVAENLRRDIDEDPLGTHAGVAAGLDPHIGRVRQQIIFARDAAGTAREALEKADQLLAELKATNTEVRDTHRQCRERIKADIEIKPPVDPGLLSGLVPWLQTLQSTVASGRLQAALIGLARWEQSAEEYLDTAKTALLVNRGLLARLDELDGLLKARRVQADKLAGQGFYVPESAEAAYRQARVTLAQRPCNLALAAGFVHTYDTAVALLSRSARRS